jgi:hypothetical protein
MEALMEFPAVKNQLAWWLGTLMCVISIVACFIGAGTGTKCVCLVMAIVAYERAW